MLAKVKRQFFVQQFDNNTVAIHELMEQRFKMQQQLNKVMENVNLLIQQSMDSKSDSGDAPSKHFTSPRNIATPLPNSNIDIPLSESINQSLN